MNVEDSYEGALRRLSRLQHAGVNLAPPPDERDRIRDLEELATLACDENERLKEELGSAQGEIERLERLTSTLQQMLASAQSDDAPAAATGDGDSEHLVHELARARGEVEHLQRLVTMLQETLAGEQSEEDALNVPKQRKAAYYFFAFAIAGAAALVLFIARPWERHAVPAVSVVETPPIAAPVAAPPVVAAPVVVAAPAPVVAPIAPKAELAVPKVEPTIPKAAATIPKVEPVKAARRHAPKPRHAAKSARHKQHKHSTVAKSGNKLNSRGDDPLGGIDID